MPLPGTKGAPKFKGAHVTDFVDDFPTCAKAAGAPDAEWPNQCLRYCANNVRRVIKHFQEFKPTASDWDAAKANLLQLYGSTDEESKFRPSKLQKFYRAARGRRMTTVQHFDKYFWEFLEMLGDVTETKMVTEKECDLYFYKGIPQRARRKIHAKLEKAGVAVEMHSPPPIKKTIEQAKSLFGEEDVDEDSDDSRGSSDKTSKDDSSGSDGLSSSEDSEPRSKRKKHRKSKEPAKSRVELKVKHEALSDSESKQVPVQASTEGIDLDHVIGTKSCPETIKLVEEGLIKLGSTGRLVRPDGSELPRALPGQEGIARVLRNDTKLRARSDPAKKDVPPHMSVLAMGLCRDGEHTRGTKQKWTTTCEEVDKDNEVVKEVRFEELLMEVAKLSNRKVQQEDEPARVRPPAVNMKEGWREWERKRQEARSEKRDTDHIAESLPLESKGNLYRFTSTLQDDVQVEEVQAQLLATKVGARAIITEIAGEVEASPMTEDEKELGGPQCKASGGQPGIALLTCGTTEDLGAILQRYTSAVSLRSKRFFAMATGFVKARFGVWEQTDVPIDEDGAQWSLRGISGEPVKLLGCCREAPLKIDGSRFDHHFFISTQETGTHDGILGQPWFHWFSCRVDYDRFGTMEVEAWPTGVKTDKLIKLRAAGIDLARNTDRLVLAAASERPSEGKEGMQQGF
ncbi:hypothetical protein CERSUDRAFT_77998 [Gelatoporia subvermispora B]|uniref:DUF4100 domain-containing protein n=1 Tax=Ceriporiopsis subvermispora (strain B) TaxID=914234 RepID=M2Q4L1_CERS8|nr:hypothetical protein CERSUDRAFT_77998 [Gelatoporia subvermispora B]